MTTTESRRVHRRFDRIVLPNGMWINVTEGDDTVVLNSYSHRMNLTALRSQSTGSKVELHLEPSESSALPVLRDEDYVVMRAGDLTAEQRARYIRRTSGGNR